MAKANLKTYQKMLRRLVMEIAQAGVDTSEQRRKLLDRKMKKVAAKIEELTKK